MSSQPQVPDSDVSQTLYRHGLSLAVLFDLLCAKGILTREEIRLHAHRLNEELLAEPTDTKA